MHQAANAHPTEDMPHHAHTHRLRLPTRGSHPYDIPLGWRAQSGGGFFASYDAVATLERCMVVRCEALSSDGAAAAFAIVEVYGGGIVSVRGASLTLRGTLLSDCRAENADSTAV